MKPKNFIWFVGQLISIAIGFSVGATITTTFGSATSIGSAIAFALMLLVDIRLALDKT